MCVVSGLPGREGGDEEDDDDDELVDDAVDDDDDEMRGALMRSRAEE